MNAVRPVLPLGVIPQRFSTQMPGLNDDSEGSTRPLLENARRAQKAWSEVALASRLQLLREFRRELVDHVASVLEPVQRVRGVSAAEILVSEIVPLADACRFLEEEATRILATRAAQGRRPLWLAGTKVRILRDPLGVVLIVGPANYPLLIAGVQVLQALAAGNAVLVKPGRGAGEVMRALRDLLLRAGLDKDVFTVLDDQDELGVRRAIAEGVDKVLLTGSSRTGVAILEAAAPTLTPATMELSGCDAAFILPGAEAALAAKALAFGLRMNRSRTCMRPHRVLVHESMRDALVKQLASEFEGWKDEPAAWPVDPSAKRVLAEALDSGAQAVVGRGRAQGPVGFPVVLEGVDPKSELGRTDAFLPVLVLYPFAKIEQALRIYEQCEYALGASVFGPVPEAARLAERINAGFVVVNDVIAPTADPRLPFSGRQRSGFGTTRAAEGLLELTRVKAVATRESNYRHLDPVRPEDSEFFSAYLRMAHGAGLRQRLSGAVNLVRAGMRRSKAGSAGA